MTEAQQLAFLRIEAKALLAGKRRQLSSDEWLYLYEKMRHALASEEANGLWDLSLRMKRMYPSEGSSQEPFDVAV